MPANIQVTEFFLNPGKLMGNAGAQQHYVNSNYTHAVRDLLDSGANVLAQMVAPDPEGRGRFSLSCNPDVTLELERQAQLAGHKLYKIAQVNPQLPYLGGEAEVPAGFFDLVVGAEPGEASTPDRFDHPLFPNPLAPVEMADYAIASHTSSMVKDGGTLQIGIGSMGDSVAYMLALRQHHNNLYRKITDALISPQHLVLRPRIPVEAERFEQGLYANSEMLVEGLIFLRQQGLLTRKVFPHAGLQTLLNRGQVSAEVSSQLVARLMDDNIIGTPLSRHDFELLQLLGCIEDGAQWEQGELFLPDGQRLPPAQQNSETLPRLARANQGKPLAGGHFCHAGFYLGSNHFYQQLRELDRESFSGLSMCSVHFTNHLYGDESLKRAQRRDARYINTGMLATLTGAVVSDGLEDYQMVSGVGGQHNFVAQAQELDDGRSIICLHSTRIHKGKTASNIVWDYPHNTIARHLRDVLVTEYGAADLRGLSDRSIIVSILNIADSRFQNELMQAAKDAGKLEQAYRIPEAFTHNYPEALAVKFHQLQADEYFPHFPLGSDFKPEELPLMIALSTLKQQGTKLKKLLPFVLTGWRHRRSGVEEFENELKRMDLYQASTAKNYLYKLLLIGALQKGRTSRPLLKSL